MLNYVNGEKVQKVRDYMARCQGRYCVQAQVGQAQQIEKGNGRHRFEMPIRIDAREINDERVERQKG